MKTRILYPKNIWFNKAFYNLSTKAKLLAVYLVSNDNISLIPIYQQKDLELSFILSIDPSEIEVLKGELEASGLFIFKDEWVCVANDFAYCDYQGRDRLAESKQKEVDNLPNELLTSFERVLKGLRSGYKPPINTTPKIINNKTKIQKQNTTQDDEGTQMLPLELPDSDAKLLAVTYLATNQEIKAKWVKFRLFWKPGMNGLPVENFESWLAKDYGYRPKPQEKYWEKGGKK